jgi:hypothetical protein
MRTSGTPHKVALAVILAAACGLVAGAAAAQERPASPELAALVPRLDGWALSEAPRPYFPETLFEYINGAAESYLSYDFRELIVADLQKTGTKATLTVEIYDMGRPLNAFGIYGSERYPENPPSGVGELDYLEGEALNFLAGRFYVKLLAFGLGEDTERTLKAFGTAIAKAIGPGPGLPRLVRAFPAEGLVARSEKYIKSNVMGYAFLRDGYVAAYRGDGPDLEGFFIDMGGEAEAEAALARLLEALAADKQEAAKAGDGHKVRNRFGQSLFIARIGAVLCGAMRVPDGTEAAGEKLLGALAAALKALPPSK